MLLRVESLQRQDAPGYRLVAERPIFDILRPEGAYKSMRVNLHVIRLAYAPRLSLEYWRSLNDRHLSQKIYNFNIRHFQKKISNLAIDLLTLGVYAPGTQVLIYRSKL